MGTSAGSTPHRMPHARRGLRLRTDTGEMSMNSKEQTLQTRCACASRSQSRSGVRDASLRSRTEWRIPDIEIWPPADSQQPGAVEARRRCQDRRAERESMDIRKALSRTACSGCCRGMLVSHNARVSVTPARHDAGRVGRQSVSTHLHRRPPRIPRTRIPVFTAIDWPVAEGRGTDVLVVDTVGILPQTFIAVMRLSVS